MQNPNKVFTYLGFCIRSGKILFGVDNVEESRRGVFLIIADGALSQNSMKVLAKKQQQLGCPLIVTKEGELATLTARSGVKAVGVKEKNLAAAILEEVKTNGLYKIYSGGSI